VLARVASVNRMRRIVLSVLGLALVVFLAAASGFVFLYSRADASTVGEFDFETELKIPPILQPRTDGAGRKVFDLDLQAGTTELVPGRTTETWSANGSYLGPTLRASRGDEMRINVHNDLPETTTLHWHGMHLPAAADGGPHQMIEPGTTWSPEWTIDQPAATLWYHPHLMGKTAEHVYRGVAGMFMLDDPEAEALPLPREYGVDDIPVILQDKSFNEDGLLDTSPGLISPTGLLGSDIFINGTYHPHLAVHDSRVRFRLLNASNARVYNVGFDDDREFDLVGTDGGLLEAPEPLKRVQLSPGERAEIVAEFRPGEEAVLRSFEPDLGADFFNERFSGGDDRFDLLQIRAADELDPSPDVPAHLVDEELSDEADAVRTRRFELEGQGSINGKSMDMARIDQVVELGTTEIWEVENTAGIPHSFHVHHARFGIVDYGGDAPPPALMGPKDTVHVRPGETVRLVVRFTDYADPSLPYMFHCHVLQHEDRGMMGQFVVVEPGQEPQTPLQDSATGHTHEP
jgi:FtsP/CotA-like multicopper oxidase with cupredoxin domain